jgi:CHAT domain-containing protein/tetratricopeptide (TPR) repeat protein
MWVPGIGRAAVLFLLAAFSAAQTDLQSLIDQADAARKQPSRANLEKARDLLREATAQTGGDGKLLAKAHYRLGQVYLSLNDPEAALAALEQARLRLEQAQDHELLPFALHNIGAAHLALGDPATAIAMFERILPMRRSAGDRAGEGYTLYGIASANWSLGQAAPALDAYRKALAIWQELKQPDNEGHSQNAMGLIFAMLGDYGRAKTAFEQALAIWRKSGNRSAPLLAWNNWCLASVGERQYADALSRCRTALDMAQEQKQTQAIAYASHNMANAYAGLRQEAKALPLYELSLSHKREAKDRWGEAATLHAMGELRLEHGDARGAGELLGQALALRREVGDRAGQAQTLGALARVDDARGAVDESLAGIREAIALIEEQRAKLASQDLRATYFASVRDFYDLQIDLLMRTGKVDEALEASARARGRLLADRLADTLAGVRGGADARLIERQRAIGRRIDAQAELLQRAAAGPGREKAVVERRIDALLNDYRDVAEQIRRASPKYAQLTQPEPVSAADFRGLLDSGTVLLQYFAGKERSYLWVVTKDRIAGHRLAGREAIARGARALLEAAAAKQDTEPAAVRLGTMLLQPAAAALSASGVRRVVIGADGEIESVPFAVLPVGGRMLVQRADVAYLPSAGGLRLYRSETRGRQLGHGIALFGDPVYSNEDPRFATRSADGLVLPRLRFSRLEAESIAKLAPASGHMLALDFDASRRTLELARLESYRMLHFATHSVSAARPELSGIALSQVDRAGKPVDGFLRLHQIYNMNLRARLVTLSSCRSATGEVLRGEGLTSIARGFLYAGAAAVAGTLWDIDDRATAELMKHFYQGMFTGGMTPAAALRAAQNAVRGRAGWEHPYYWAGFVLHGEWR